MFVCFRWGRTQCKFGFVGGETIGSAAVPPPPPPPSGRFDMSIATQPFPTNDSAAEKRAAEARTLSSGKKSRWG
jgi:hypothetical protein